MAKADKPIIPIYKCEAYLVPISKLAPGDVEAANNRFTYNFYNEKKCKSCDNLPERHSDLCDACAGFLGRKRTSKVVRKNNREFLSMPVGASKKVKKWLIGRGYSERYVVKKRHYEGKPFKRAIKVLGKPYGYQDEAVATMLKKKRGILESPPRSGKTVMGACVIAAVGRKTLILGSQREWLLNFQETFIGSETQKAFTNCRPSQIKICRTLKDFQGTDICLSSFAKFMSPAGKKLLMKIRDLFHVVIVDECFTAEHEVLTNKGYVPIAEVVANQSLYQVASWSHILNKVEFKPVLATGSKQSEGLLEIYIEDTPIRCTPNHPFWSMDRQTYVKAGDLRAGENVLTLKP